jgi:hypothetical protein
MTDQSDPIRYRVVRDRYLGYEAQFKVAWWFPLWLQCCWASGGWGVNTNQSLRAALQVCADHFKRRRNLRRVGQVVAQFSLRELEALPDD